MYLRFQVLCIMVRFPRNEELVGYVAQRLRELRLERSLSQEKVLFETGVRVEHIEAGRNNVTISTLHALCALYGVTLHEFFAPPAPPQETDAAELSENPESTEEPEARHDAETSDGHE